MAALALNLLIFLPLAAAVLVWLGPERRTELPRRIALGVSLLTFVLALGLWVDVAPGRLTGETERSWIAVGDWVPVTDDRAELSSGLLIRYHVGLDPVSGALVLLTGLLVPLAVAGSFTGIRTRQREYYAWMLALTSAMFGVFAARDVILFYIFFEFTLVPLYFLIGIWGGPERRYAANKFFLFTFVGSVITFAGLLYLGIRAAQLAHDPIVSFGFDRFMGLDGLGVSEQALLFAALFAGFAIKVPLFPLHTWLPLAHTEAPTAGSVLLAGILLKLGTYGFLRLALPVVPEGALYWTTTMGWLAVAGIIYGALCSWLQRDVKKLVAYSSVSHLGFCMLGMFSLLPVGLSGSVLYMINHGISTGALFLVVGMLYERYHTRDMTALGGLAWQMPVLAFFLVLFTLSSIGLPGLNGFVSEFTVLLAAYNSPHLGPTFGVLGATGILLGAVYMLYMCGRVLFGPVKEPAGTPDLSAGLPRDLGRREVAILAPLAVLVVLLGVYPRLVTDPIDPLLHDEILARFTPPAAVAAAEPVALLEPAGTYAAGGLEP